MQASERAHVGLAVVVAAAVLGALASLMCDLWGWCVSEGLKGSLAGPSWVIKMAGPLPFWMIFVARSTPEAMQPLVQSVAATGLLWTCLAPAVRCGEAWALMDVSGHAFVYATALLPPAEAMLVHAGSWGAESIFVTVVDRFCWWSLCGFFCVLAFVTATFYHTWAETVASYALTAIGAAVVNVLAPPTVTLHSSWSWIKAASAAIALNWFSVWWLSSVRPSQCSIRANEVLLGAGYDAIVLLVAVLAPIAAVNIRKAH